MQSPALRRDFEQSPFTRTPRVLLKYDMSHHFTFISSRLQGSQEKLGLIVSKVRSLSLLITGENPGELPRRAAAGHRPGELIPQLCRCVVLGIQELSCQKHAPTSAILVAWKIEEGFGPDDFMNFFPLLRLLLSVTS